MQYKEGANVFTADGSEVGDIDRVVLDPNTQEITHLVVRKGLLFTKDKLVPVEAVRSATDERVTLNEVDDRDALPDFEEMHYVRADEISQKKAYASGYAQPYYWYPPTHLTWWDQTPPTLYPAPPYVVEIKRNIPKGTVPLKEGADVITADDEQVGEIERLYADPTQDRATHLLLSKGLFFKEKKLVPTLWISQVSENEVHLSVSSGFINNLPEYEQEE
jgi:uncharacterized protein YrrD